MVKKKEKLEQMRELGRGGLSKGLNFLRTAKNNASLENGEASAASSLSNTEEGGSTTSRMTYEELLALSMKLTRQNKLMKVQYQKNQSTVAAANKYEVDAQALRSFLELELGLDVATCVRTDSPLKGSIDVEALKSKYRTLSSVQLKDESQVHAPVDSVKLLPLSPVTATKHEAIDFLAGDHQNVAYEDAQMNEAMQQVERMREKLRQSVEQAQKVELKLQAQNKQQEEMTRVLATENEKLKEKEAEWRTKWEKEAAANGEKTQRLAELETTMQAMSIELKASLEQREEKQKEIVDVASATVGLENKERDERRHQDEAAAVLQEKVGNKTEVQTQRVKLEVAEAHSAQLEEELKALRISSAALKDQAKDVIEKHYKADAIRRHRPVLALHEGSGTISDDDAIAMVAATLEAQQAELEEAEAENGRLQCKLDALQPIAAILLGDMSNDCLKEKVEAALEALKVEQLRLCDQLKHVQPTAASISSAKALEKAGIAVHAEVDRLQGLLDVKTSNCEALQREITSLKELGKAKDNALQEASRQDADPSLLQELEHVRLELAERAHESQSLQEKLCAAGDQVVAANSKREATQALVDELEKDTGRLVNQIAQFEKKEILLTNELAALTKTKDELEEQQHHAQEAKAAMKKQLEEERAYWTSKLETLITASDAATNKVETLEAELEEKAKHVTRMATSQTSMTAELMELQKQMNRMREDLAMAADSLEAQATKIEEYERRDLASKTEVTELTNRLDEMRDRHHENFEMLRKEKEGELERVHAERRALLAAKTELCHETEELNVRCKTVERELEAAEKREEELESSVSDRTLQIDSLSLELADTKKALSDRMALATRLQTDNMGMAGKLAEQVALIEGALRDAAKSKVAQQEMETQVHAAKANVECIKKSETAVKQNLDTVQREMQEQETRFQRERQEAQLALRAAVESEQCTFQRELDRLEAESKHKSKLALQAVLEKEKEIAHLHSRLHEVEEDVRSGGADNRKIVELAQVQAKREVDQREQVAQMQALARQVEAAQREIRDLHEDKRRRVEELTAMVQNQRRDGVNMEYLKNVVVQYLSFRPGTSEQARLVPVLTTLLQFTAADIKKIKRAARRGNGWTSWGSSDPGLDYKPFVVGAGHQFAMALPSSPDNGGPSFSFSRKGSAPVPRVTPPAKPLVKSSRASSFVLPDSEHVESFVASVDF